MIFSNPDFQSLLPTYDMTSAPSLSVLHAASCNFPVSSFMFRPAFIRHGVTDVVLGMMLVIQTTLVHG